MIISKIFARYLKALNIWKTLRSYYFLSALVIHIFLLNNWLSHDWWDLPILILPNLLGFTLSGLAIFLSFVDREFRQILLQQFDDEESTPFFDVLTTYTHFLLVMSFALLFAVFSNGAIPVLESFTKIETVRFEGIESFSVFAVVVLSNFGHFLFIYSLVLLISAILGLYRVAVWYEDFSNDCEE